MKFTLVTVICALVLFSGCKPKPEEYMGKAVVLINEKNFTGAVEEYEKLIKDHPDSPQAEEALFSIASLRNDELHDFAGAVDAYSRYVEKYPQGRQAPVALFLSAYLYANELHDLPRAKTAYEQFLARYPEHEMAKSAQFEVQNLGRKPEDILPAIQPQKEPVPQASKPPKKK